MESVFSISKILWHARIPLRVIAYLSDKTSARPPCLTNWLRDYGSLSVNGLRSWHHLSLNFLCFHLDLLVSLWIFYVFIWIYWFHFEFSRFSFWIISFTVRFYLIFSQFCFTCSSFSLIFIDLQWNSSGVRFIRWFSFGFGNNC